MRLTLSCLTLLAVAIPGFAASGQAPAGYYPGTPISLPDTLHEVWHGTRFRIAVTRVAHDSLERHLLQHAERLMPPADSIQAAAATVTRGNWPRVFAEAAARPGERWWWHEFSNVLIPYALTGATVVHLVQRVRELSAQPNPFGRSHPGVDHTAAVEYRARVERTADVQAPYQVQLEVRFRFYCGSLCALYFTHSRTVDFDARGRVVRIRGDGHPRYIVS